MVTEFLQQAPDWTALRCRLLFGQATPGEVTLDVVMSADQPDGADWDTPPGSPFTVVLSVPSKRWLAGAVKVLGGWAREGCEIELRRTRAWEEGSQVLIWGPGATLLVTLVA